MTTPRPLVAGNWKMHGHYASSEEVNALVQMLRDRPAECDVVVCPPFTLLMPFSNLIEGYGISLGGQDCHHEPAGAHTGDISADMLKDAACSYVIVGHSERRKLHRESDKRVSEKADMAHNEGLCAIVCVGETEKQHDAGETLSVIAGQLSKSLPDNSVSHNTVVAYEPIWAIGTGRTPSNEEIGEVHGLIRKHLTGRFGLDGQNFRILYGGSVKPDNAGELMAINNVDGALVGGASLKAIDFNGIIEAYR